MGCANSCDGGNTLRILQRCTACPSRKAFRMASATFLPPCLAIAGITSVGLLSALLQRYLQQRHSSPQLKSIPFNESIPSSMAHHTNSILDCSQLPDFTRETLTVVESLENTGHWRAIHASLVTNFRFPCSSYPFGYSYGPSFFASPKVPAFLKSWSFVECVKACDVAPASSVAPDSACDTILDFVDLHKNQLSALWPWHPEQPSFR